MKWFEVYDIARTFSRLPQSWQLIENSLKRATTHAFCTLALLPIQNWQLI